MPQLARRDAHEIIAFDMRSASSGSSAARESSAGGRLREGAHLDPVSEQHDHDQQSQLPPELQLVIQEPESGTPGGDERDGDRGA